MRCVAPQSLSVWGSVTRGDTGDPQAPGARPGPAAGGGGWGVGWRWPARYLRETFRARDAASPRGGGAGHGGATAGRPEGAGLGGAGAERGPPQPAGPRTPRPAPLTAPSAENDPAWWCVSRTLPSDGRSHLNPWNTERLEWKNPSSLDRPPMFH